MAGLRWSALALWLVSSVAHASPLSELAAGLGPGEWAELSTDAIDPLEVGGHEGHVLPYSQSAAWDPVTRTLHFVGGDHGSGGARYFVYAEDTNRWSDLGVVFLEGAALTSHGYEHLAIDPVARRAYLRRYGIGVDPDARRIFARDLDGTTDWRLEDTFPDAYAQVAIAITHAAGVGLVVYNCGEPGGQLAILRADGAWSDVRGFGGESRYSCVAEASAPLDLVVVGGGGGDARHVWQLRDGEVSALPDAPIGIGTSYEPDELHQGHLVADPVSGELLLLGSGQMFALDPTDGRGWRTLAAPATAVRTDGDLVSAPVPELGVIFFVSCEASRCSVSIYRHAAGTGEPPPDVGIGLDAGLDPVDPDAGRLELDASVSADAGPGAPSDAPDDLDGSTPPAATGCVCAVRGTRSTSGLGAALVLSALAMRRLRTVRASLRTSVAWTLGAARRRDA